LKLVTWNCNGAFRKKIETISQLKADVYIIQECEDPAACTSSFYKEWATNYLWIGDSKNKGLGVFASQQINLTQLAWNTVYKDHSVKYFLPCMVNDVQLLAVWTHYNNSPNFGYMGQFWKFLQLHKNQMNNIIIAGDFNSNTIWDEWDRWWNHSDVVRELSEIGIKSLYHMHTKEMQGKETIPTFYLQKKLAKPYHIDYCFASKKYAEKVTGFEIEPFEKWKHLSDHTPMVITMKD
jgi:exonuclease III